MTMLPLSATGLTALEDSPYEVLRDRLGLLKLDVTFDKNLNEIPVGTILTKRTDTGRFLARKSSRLTAQGNTGQPVIVVASAVPWKVGDAIHVTGEAAMTVLAVNQDTNTITLSANLTGNRAAGVVVYDDTLGMNKAVAICVDVGVPARSYEQFGSAAVVGNFIASKIRNFDAEARTDLNGNYIEEFDLYHI